MQHSAQADALALPGFSFGLDVLLLVGTSRLGAHHTLDEVHWALLYRLGELGVSISRREVAYLIETYGALLRARWKGMSYGWFRCEGKEECCSPSMGFSPTTGTKLCIWFAKCARDGCSWLNPLMIARRKRVTRLLLPV